MVRTVEPIDVVRKRVESCLSPNVELELTSKAYPPVDFSVPDGHAGITVAFGTDVPHMPRWGKPMLYGPGSILDAHTDHERVSKQALLEAAAEYERAVRWSLERIGSPARA
jgi:acetylornithine deacetylase